MPPARKSSPPDEKKNSFEQSLEELERIVEKMESEQRPLNELIDQYERGSQLFMACDQLLGQARERLELITLKAREQHSKSDSIADIDDAADDESTDQDDIRLF